MASTRKLPFQHMTSANWQNLGLAALSIFYVIQIGFDLFWHNTCGHLAIDYCAFWSAGRAANLNGYPAIYHLDLLRQIQLSIFPKLPNLASFQVSPIAYLPVFIIPFQLLSDLNPLPGYFLWSMINLIILGYYLRFFIQRIVGHSLQIRLLGMVLFSLPVYWNFFNGQYNVWLVICVGEFIRAEMSDRSFKAGLWLGGLLIKPQVLILIILALSLQRAAKALAGLATSSFAILGVSWLMIGKAGFQGLIELWLGFSGGLPTNDVEIMMNWRMLGLHLGSALSPIMGWILIGLGLTATLLATIYIWHRPLNLASHSFVIAILGLMAATCLFAWHSHIHMAMIIIPPMIYLKSRNQLPDKILNYWVFLPAGVYAGVFLLASLITANVLPTNLNAFLNFLRGASEFGINIYLLIWVVRFFRLQDMQPHSKKLQAAYS